jgi:hypothetical protein
MRVNEILLVFFKWYSSDWSNTGKGVFAKVVPILKPGKSPATPDSYRPISLIGCGRKLMEKMFVVEPNEEEEIGVLCRWY